MLIYFHGGTLHPMRFYYLEPDNVSRGKPKNVPHVCDLHAWALLHPSHFDANFVTLLPSVSIESIGGHQQHSPSEVSVSFSHSTYAHFDHLSKSSSNSSEYRSILFSVFVTIFIKTRSILPSFKYLRAFSQCCQKKNGNRVSKVHQPMKILMFFPSSLSLNIKYSRTRRVQHNVSTATQNAVERSARCETVGNILK